MSRSHASLQQAARPEMWGRFWAKVDITPSSNSCWGWQGSRDASGYGLFGVPGEGTRRAHRLAYEYACGPIPAGLILLHGCDNPPCVRPSHLRVGTHADNCADRDAKGRHRSLPGEQHPNAKLTADDVHAIRTSPDDNKQIAARFGITPGHAWRIRTNKSWN